MASYGDASSLFGASDTANTSKHAIFNAFEGIGEDELAFDSNAPSPAAQTSSDMHQGNAYSPQSSHSQAYGSPHYGEYNAAGRQVQQQHLNNHSANQQATRNSYGTAFETPTMPSNSYFGNVNGSGGSYGTPRAYGPSTNTFSPPSMNAKPADQAKRPTSALMRKQVDAYDPPSMPMRPPSVNKRSATMSPHGFSTAQQQIQTQSNGPPPPPTSNANVLRNSTSSMRTAASPPIRSPPLPDANSFYGPQASSTYNPGPAQYNQQAPYRQGERYGPSGSVSSAGSVDVDLPRSPPPPPEHRPASALSRNQVNAYDPPPPSMQTRPSSRASIQSCRMSPFNPSKQQQEQLHHQTSRPSDLPPPPRSRPASPYAQSNAAPLPRSGSPFNQYQQYGPATNRAYQGPPSRAASPLGRAEAWQNSMPSMQGVFSAHNHPPSRPPSQPQHFVPGQSDKYGAPQRSQLAAQPTQPGPDNSRPTSPYGRAGPTDFQSWQKNSTHSFGKDPELATAYPSNSIDVEEEYDDDVGPLGQANGARVKRHNTTSSRSSAGTAGADGSSSPESRRGSVSQSPLATPTYEHDEYLMNHSSRGLMEQVVTPMTSSSHSSFPQQAPFGAPSEFARRRSASPASGAASPLPLSAPPPATTLHNAASQALHTRAHGPPPAMSQQSSQTARATQRMDRAPPERLPGNVNAERATRVSESRSSSSTPVEENPETPKRENFAPVIGSEADPAVSASSEDTQEEADSTVIVNEPFATESESPEKEGHVSGKQEIEDLSSSSNATQHLTESNSSHADSDQAYIKSPSSSLATKVEEHPETDASLAEAPGKDNTAEGWPELNELEDEVAAWPELEEEAAGWAELEDDLILDTTATYSHKSETADQATIDDAAKRENRPSDTDGAKDESILQGPHADFDVTPRLGTAEQFEGPAEYTDEQLAMPEASPTHEIDAMKPEAQEEAEFNANPIANRYANALLDSEEYGEPEENESVPAKIFNDLDDPQQWRLEGSTQANQAYDNTVPQTTTPFSFSQQHSDNKQDSEPIYATGEESYAQSTLRDYTYDELDSEQSLEMFQPSHVPQQYDGPQNIPAHPPPPFVSQTSHTKPTYRSDAYAPYKQVAETPASTFQRPFPYANQPNPYEPNTNPYTPNGQAHQPKSTHQSPVSREKKLPTTSLLPPRPPQPMFAPPPDVSIYAPRASPSLQQISRQPYPVAVFAFGGRLLTAFPSCFLQTSSLHSQGLYSNLSVHKDPLTQSTVKMHNLADLVGDSSLESFPGPLLTGAKSSSSHSKVKKEVNAWLDRRIGELEKEAIYIAGAPARSDAHKAEDRRLLMHALRLFVENDGRLMGITKAEEQMKEALMPAHSSESEANTAPFQSAMDLHALRGKASNEPALTTTSITSSDFKRLKTCLASGDRRAAIRYASDRQLWAHALLLASSLDREIWKEVVADFIRADLSDQGSGSGSDALKVLYGTLGGLGSLAIDSILPKQSLAPPATGTAALPIERPVGITGSAPVSRSATPAPFGAPAQIDVSKFANVTNETLDSWQETAAYLMSNRCAGDSAALSTLSEVLAANGRSDAAQLCALLAIPQNMTTPPVHLRLTTLGSGGDEEAIALAEIMEWAFSLIPIAKGQEPYIGLPSIQAYRLIRARKLADSGRFPQALRYCEAIEGTLKLANKRPALYNSALLSHLQTLTERLTNRNGSGPNTSSASSWVSRKTKGATLESFWGSLEGRFTSFVAGDSPAEKTATPPAATANAEPVIGPFSHYSAISPAPTPSAANSRNQSTTDLRTAAAAQQQPTPFTNTGGIYDSTNAYAPAVSRMPTQPPASASAAPKPLPPAGYKGHQHKRSQSMGFLAYGADPYASAPSWAPPAVSQQTQQPDVIPEESPEASLDEPKESSYAQSSSWWTQDSSASQRQPSFQQVDAPLQEDDSGFVSMMDGRQPSFGAANSSKTAVPSRNFAQEEDEDDLGFGNSKPRKPSLDTADDQSESEPSNLDNTDRRTQSRSEPAADNNKSLNAPPALRSSSSFFSLGRLFRKEGNAPTPSGPVKANLGEETSFVYDPELKRWVNKKAGASNDQSSTPTSTPPPPRSPAFSAASTASPPTSSSTPPPPARPASAAASSMAPPPPVRPASAQASVSGGSASGPPPPSAPASADGPPPQRRAVSGAAKKSARSRYVEIS